jgi:VPDSG-CTERM motif
MKLIPTSKLALLCTAVCATMFAFSNNANALTIGDTHELGFIVAGNVGLQERMDFVNHLIGMAAPSSDTFNNNSFSRSSNFASPFVLPAATTTPGTVDFTNPPSTVSINIGSQGTFTYLYAKYDGQNAGTEVWYIGDLSGIITIPGFLGQYGLSGYTLFGTGGNGVPDGGTTVMLLGAALGALGMARRFLKI